MILDRPTTRLPKHSTVEVVNLESHSRGSAAHAVDVAATVVGCPLPVVRCPFRACGRRGRAPLGVPGGRFFWE